MKNLSQTVEPFRNLKDVEKIKRYLLGKSNSKRDYCIFVVGINVGLRAGDLVKLRIFDVYDGCKVRNDVTVIESKTKKVRNFALNKSAREAIELYIKTLNDVDLNDYLFVSRKGGHIGVRPLHYIIKSTARELGIVGNYGTHSLRKSFSAFRYQNGVPIEILQKLLNHASSQTTLRYIGAEREILYDAYNAVNL